MIGVSTIDLSRLMQARTDNDVHRAASELRAVAATGESTGLPTRFLRANAEALLTGDWRTVGRLFERLEFIGPQGELLLVAPCRIRRMGQESSDLLILHARVVPVDMEPLSGVELAFEEIGLGTTERSERILGIEVLAASGRIGGRDGEAFITPDAWIFPGSERGPAMNVVAEQRRRFAVGRAAIRAVFAPATAGLLLQLLDDGGEDQARHWEYQLHELGHTTGLGLRRKVESDLLRTPWCRGVEEARSDGIAFAAAIRHLPECLAARVVASNFCTRFGVDAHRAGGIDRDLDVFACVIALEHLLASGALELGSQLELHDPTPAGLLRAARSQASWARELTEQELRLTHPEGLWRLYGSVAIHRGTEAVFQHFVCNAARGHQDLL